MLALSIEYEDGRVQRLRLPLPICIGRSRKAHLHIAAWRVAREHASLTQRTAGVYLEDGGSLTGTMVNGRRVAHYGPLRIGDILLIGPCRMRVESLPSAATRPVEPASDEAAVPIRKVGAENARYAAQAAPVVSPDACVPDMVSACQADTGGRAALVGSAFSADTQVCPSHPDPPPADVDRDDAENRLIDESGAGQARRQHLRDQLLKALDLRRHDLAMLDDEALRVEALSVLRRIVASQGQSPDDGAVQILMRDVVNEAVGLGPLETLLADEAITEIMVNRYDEIYVEVGGRLHRHVARFSCEQSVLGVVDRIVSPLGRRIDDSSPMVDARLPDGSRVNAVIPPVALRGTCLTIRKFPRQRLGMADLLRLGALDASMADFLAACVVQRRNIVVSGGTGSGKTTLLNVLSNCIPLSERIVTIEDAAELRLDHAHLVSMEARPANMEGRGAISIRDLVRNALRMRPDRIVVGECRGGEAFDMLTAMNTGHEGSLTTLHANSPRDALARLETMILMAGMDLPLGAVREHIAAAVDLIVQQVRMADGHRRIHAIVEVTGMESGRIQTQPLFRIESGPPPVFAGCQVLPEFLSGQMGAAPEQGRPVIDIGLFSQRTAVESAGQAPRGARAKVVPEEGASGGMTTDATGDEHA